MFGNGCLYMCCDLLQQDVTKAMSEALFLSIEASSDISDHLDVLKPLHITLCERCSNSDGSLVRPEQTLEWDEENLSTSLLMRFSSSNRLLTQCIIDSVLLTL